jgi:hypothetical protein
LAHVSTASICLINTVVHRYCSLGYDGKTSATWGKKSSSTNALLENIVLPDDIAVVIIKVREKVMKTTVINSSFGSTGFTLVGL